MNQRKFLPHLSNVEAMNVSAELAAVALYALRDSGLPLTLNGSLMEAMAESMRVWFTQQHRRERRERAERTTPVNR